MIFPASSTRKLNIYDANKEEIIGVDVPYHNPRIGASSVIIDDTLYVIGGRDYNVNYTEIADQNYKSVISLSLKDLQFPNNTETPGDKDPEPTTPPKDDTTDEDGDALLIITMVNGLQKEYDLSMKEVNAFLSWYKNVMPEKDQVFMKLMSMTTTKVHLKVKRIMLCSKTFSCSKSINIKVNDIKAI